MNEISNCSIKKSCSNHGVCWIISLYIWLLFQISKCMYYLESFFKVSLCLNVCLRCDLPNITRWKCIWCLPYTSVFVYHEAGRKKGRHFTYHCNDVIIGTMASQITSLAIVYSTVYSGADQAKHQSSASLAFARGIHWWPVNSPHKGPVTRKMFPFHDVIMRCFQSHFPMSIVIVRPRFHWNLLPGVPLTVAQNWQTQCWTFLDISLFIVKKINILMDMSDVCA